MGCCLQIGLSDLHCWGRWAASVTELRFPVLQKENTLVKPSMWSTSSQEDSGACEDSSLVSVSCREVFPLRDCGVVALWSCSPFVGEDSSSRRLRSSRASSIPSKTPSPPDHR